MGGVDHQPLEVGLIHDDGQEFFPDPLVPPAAEATVDLQSVSIHGRQVAPRGASAQYPCDGVDKLPVVPGYAAPVAWFAGEMGGDDLPSPVGNVVSVQGVVHLILPWAEHNFHRI